MSRKLLVIHPDQVMEVQFDQQITIGRDVFNSLSLQDPEISRSHAILFEQEGETIVKDLKSRNGVFVNGERVMEGSVKSGDEIILGSTVLIFDPGDTLDLGQALSKRGRYLIEKRTARTAGQPPEPATVFSLDEMEQSVQKLLSEPSQTSFFTLQNAMGLIQAFKAMDDSAGPSILFQSAVRRALTLLGGHRGVIMEVDESKQHLKVRAILSTDNSETIMIGQPVLKLVIGGEKCVYCSNILRDHRFAGMAKKTERPMHSFVAVPIRSHEELFGLIYLDSEDASVTYDYAALRSLYMIATHLGSLLHPRPMHFQKHATTGTHPPTIP